MNIYQNKQVNDFLRVHAAQIIEFARQQFTTTQKRGFVTVVAKNDPKNPDFKEGRYYYITEAQNNKIMSMTDIRTEYDLKLEKDLQEYNPRAEAVVLVWYKTLYKEVRMIDKTSWN